MRRVCILVFVINSCYCMLWKKGVVHFAIDKDDYDIHSQDTITSTLTRLQDEICLKFFHVPPPKQSLSTENKLLYIENSHKQMTCPPNTYDFNSSIVIMPIGYKCMNSEKIARIVADMLRASIEQTVSSINSYDLVKKFEEKEVDAARPTLLSSSDRNFINAHYHTECGALTARVWRRQGATQMRLTEEGEKYYEGRVWPLGVVLYGLEEGIRGSQDYALLKYAMTSIELSTCVVFQEMREDDVLSPRNFLWFGSSGEELPFAGFRTGNQSISLKSMTHGAAGHKAHLLNNLMRALGIHMMSNRFDRDNYVIVNWKNVQRGKEHYFEKAPEHAWVDHVPYDFDSVTHAPANYMCAACELGGATVQPIQDHLWQKTLSMGHRTQLSESDIQLSNMIYDKQCRNRYVAKAGDK